MPVYWLLGLPFDLTTMDEVRQRVFEAAESRKQLVFATPNVNFVAQAARQPQFRSDVLHAGLSLVDGMPVVWLGRLLKVPFAERIAGSDLLESLISRPGPRPLRVFFFGGEQGAAEEAMRATNRRGGGLIAVGAHYPGFSSVAEMSEEKVIGAINRSGADLLVVALGAAKGHRWIEANRHRLAVPVISHLGAAINFIAGRLQRAPKVTHQLGLEWLWRIKEEPALLSRYVRDGWFLVGRVATFVVPEYIRQRTGRHQAAAVNVLRATDGSRCIQIDRCLRLEEARELPIAASRIELRNVTRVDAAGIGWLYSSRYRAPADAPPVTICADAASRAVLRRWQADLLITGDC